MSPYRWFASWFNTGRPFVQFDFPAFVFVVVHLMALGFACGAVFWSCP